MPTETGDLKKCLFLLETVRSVKGFEQAVFFIADDRTVYCVNLENKLGVPLPNDPIMKWGTLRNREEIMRHMLFTSMQDVSEQLRNAKPGKLFPVDAVLPYASRLERLKEGFGL